jgi:radical SAM protein with 4Fe4S-binding SPASM domain
LSYAKDKGLEVRLNTNGSLLTKESVKLLAGVVDNVLLPIESYKSESEDEITGYKNALEKKIQAVYLLKKAGIPVIRVGTVATKEVINNFNNYARLILSLPIDEWEFYRPVIFDDKMTDKNYKIDKLVEAIDKIKRKTEKKISIANAVPFCCVKNLDKINGISSGALYDEGHRRLVVDPRGFYKPSYYMDINLGDALDVKAAWNNPFMKKMRNLRFLPKKCYNCNYKYKCCGGSRFVAFQKTKSWSAMDPMLD